MKTTKNIKKPTYAVMLANGIFVGACWQCQRCGKYKNTSGSNRPSAKGCPEGGNHFWVMEHE